MQVYEKNIILQSPTSSYTGCLTEDLFIAISPDKMKIFQFCFFYIRLTGSRNTNISNGYVFFGEKYKK